MKKESFIEIKDLELHCSLGCTKEERAYPQKIFVTCRMYGDYSQSEKSDDITETVSYSEVAEAIEELVKASSFKLLEHLAFEIRKIILVISKGYTVEVEVVKPNAIEKAKHASFTLRV